ncbi:[FeFe] hydrogenase H-cluster maturation GTPase HydF [Paenibacillus sp. HN-1]|uniref:[FeFe] hydrogenase H-cluster maturation GTPase HydF n=1 Tax=Paenibacillus TaxID=44249 RepID=UPI001CA9B09C|nr:MULTISPECIES: [FeFe] hydrogenase H-cluster maturation GTPase HydF [Paenibacillus]MBY9078463.1 [FeFe] hydrogenase H-cluster maturation GTPase HydF [Paenibacillus sp. CGMCC 1.18879]MBY9082756.1 [FeFe] hydrogenase H-cluster maturation GTPase HydF [Paenibacillus sinensis]
MNMNNTPRGERPHIAVFGRCNAGKSSVINALAGQPISIVSPVSGTTTDPVFQPMELLPVGPVVLIDTAGMDDTGELGRQRVQRSMGILDRTDLALLVVDAAAEAGEIEQELMKTMADKGIPAIVLLNKADLLKGGGIEEAGGLAAASIAARLGVSPIPVSASTGAGIGELKKRIISVLSAEEDRYRIVGDLLQPGDTAVLVVPIDKAAPKGRLILPQQQTIRDILECDASAVVTKEQELRHTLDSLGKKPSLVITDSQAFLKAEADTPRDVPLTSFSILFARYKGDLPSLVGGVKAIARLRDGDRVLIAEACSHHRQSDDIGTVKIPRWLRENTGRQLRIEHVSGHDFPADLEQYALIIHCGACMLNRRVMQGRIAEAQSAGVPIVNYGVFIAYVQGVFPRAIEMFPSAMMAWEQR